ncbi:MAG: AsmA family protein [Bdellovibrionales bacterium]
MRLFLAFIAFLGLLIVGLLVAPSFIDLEKYKMQGLEEVKKTTGYDVAVSGPLKIGFLPSPHVMAEKVSVVNTAVSKDPVAKFERLSIGVAVAPLFQKQVQVTHIKLKQPIIDLRVDRDGKGNWLSPEVAAILNKGRPEQDQSDGTSAIDSNISFENIRIEQGAFRYFDARTGKDTQITEADVTLSANSLIGPFDANGKLMLNKQSVRFDVNAGSLDKAADTIPLNAKVQYGGHSVSIKGVAGIAAPFDVQGQVGIELSSEALPISEGVTINGILSANQARVDLKDSTVQVGASSLKGQVGVDLKQLSVQANYNSSDVIDVSRFLPKQKGASQKTDPLLMLTEILPQTITLPQDFTADVTLKTGGFVYDQILFKDTLIEIGKKDKAFSAAFRANDIPGTGPAKIEGDVVFASQSTSKNGMQVFSDPTLKFLVQANTQNTSQFVKALTGVTNIPVISASRIGKFYITGNAKPGRFALKDSVVNLDDLKVSMNGDVKQGAAKPEIDFSITSSVDDPYAFARSLNMNTDSWPKNLKAVTVGADLTGAIDTLNVDAKLNAFGADFSVSGKLDELKSASGINNLRLRVKHSNLAQFLQTLGASAPAYGTLSKPIDASLVVTMDGKVVQLKQIDATLLGTKLNGSVGYDMGASKPSASGDLKFGSLVLKTAQGAQKTRSGSSGSTGSAGKWSDQAMDSGWLHAINANFNVSADRLVFEAWDITKPELSVQMQNGAMSISNLKGGLFKGQIAVQSKVASSSPSAPLSMSTTAKISNVDIGQLAETLSGSKKLDGDGTVSLDMNVSGTGVSQRALISSLTGDANLNGQDLILRGFDLAGLASALLESNKPLPRVQQLVNSSSSGGQTSFDTLKGVYAINNGIVGITSMELDGPTAMISSTGNVDLPRWYIDANHKITLKKATDISAFDVPTKGPLDNPKTTFSKALFDTYLNEKLGEKIQELVGDDIGNVLQQFGVIPKQQKKAPANDNTQAEPASGDAAQPIQEQKQQPKTIEEELQDAAGDALNDVLKGLF